MPYLGHAFGDSQISINEAPPTGCYFEVTIFPGYLNPFKNAKSVATDKLSGLSAISAINLASIQSAALAGIITTSVGLIKDNDTALKVGVGILSGVLGINPLDFRFHRVTGLESKIETDDIRAGGVNTEMLQLPNRVTHGNLVLERGLFLGSPLTLEFNLAMNLFQMIPGEILVTLQRPDKIPIAAWLFRDAYPVGWSNSDLWSDDNNISMEKMEFAYSRMHSLRI